MALEFRDYANHEIEVEEGTPGGDTYYINGVARCFTYTAAHNRAIRVMTNGASSDINTVTQKVVDKLLKFERISFKTDDCHEEYAWLGAIVFDGNGMHVGTVGHRCSFVAGHGTDHKGTGRCHIHDGFRIGVGLKNGRRSKMGKKSLELKIQKYVMSSDQIDLRRELAIQRTMLDSLLDIVEDIEETALPGTLSDIIKFADMIGRQVERISKIGQRDALTAAQVLYLQVTVTDILTRYIIDPIVREKAALELVDRLGTRNIEIAYEEEKFSFSEKQLTSGRIGRRKRS